MSDRSGATGRGTRQTPNSPQAVTTPAPQESTAVDTYNADTGVTAIVQTSGHQSSAGGRR